MVAPKKNMGVKVILPGHLELVTSSEIADKQSKMKALCSCGGTFIYKF